ncbi:MAG TPA: hypothetical protein VGR07_19620 [Thermoanaerobaculia bacterium]|jgi:hypothetical protein|nr:hypothetical protein [Thermoanaerobaculia bacterium]
MTTELKHSLRELALRAFNQGFLAATDPRRKTTRQVVEPATHEHWLAGHKAGIIALRDASREYGAHLDARAETTAPTQLYIDADVPGDPTFRLPPARRRKA